jgi:hypothetical protein
MNIIMVISKVGSSQPCVNVCWCGHKDKPDLGDNVVVVRELASSELGVQQLSIDRDLQGLRDGQNEHDEKQMNEGHMNRQTDR